MNYWLGNVAKQYTRAQLLVFRRLLHRVYRQLLWVAETSDPETRNRVLVLRVLLIATLGAVVLALSLLLYSYFGLHFGYVLPRILLMTLVVVCTFALYAVSFTRHHRVAAGLLVLVYFAIATAVVYRWGINATAGILLYGFVVVLAGILLGARYSLYTAACVALVLIVLTHGMSTNMLHPDRSWALRSPTMGDVAGFCLLFAVLALVSWLFNFQMERSLRRARLAEAALERQKALLEATVAKRTRELQASQLEKVQQLYHFAELGQVSTALLHELANHITTLSLDIESLAEQDRSHMLHRIKRSIGYVEDMVKRVRDQLRGKSQIKIFNTASEIESVMQVLRHKAAVAGVTLRWKTPPDATALRCRGDATRFRQVVTNLLSNGIDAYRDIKGLVPEKLVEVTAVARTHTIVVSIRDRGCGISPEHAAKIFEPFYSTKKTGMGLGLFLAKQIIEESFRGSIRLDIHDGTTFVLTLSKDGK